MQSTLQIQCRLMILEPCSYFPHIHYSATICVIQGGWRLIDRSALHRIALSDRHGRRHGRMVLIPFQPEIARLDPLQPLRRIDARVREGRHALVDHQPRRRERLALELFAQHVQVVLVDVRVADEISEPARRVARQPTEQRQQRRAFGEVERRAEKTPAPNFMHITLCYEAFQAICYMCIIAFAQSAIKLLLQENQAGRNQSAALDVSLHRPKDEPCPSPPRTPDKPTHLSDPTLVAKW